MRLLLDGSSLTLVLALSLLMPAVSYVSQHVGLDETQFVKEAADGKTTMTNAVKALDEKDEIAIDTDRQIRLLNKALDASRKQLSKEGQAPIPKAVLSNDRWAEDLVREAIDGMDLTEIYGSLGRVG